MDVLIDKLNSYELEIQVGDLFSYEDFDEATFYVLARCPNGMLTSQGHDYKAISLSGDAIWSSFNTLEEAKDELSRKVLDGTLKHFPKDQWELKLIRK